MSDKTVSQYQARRRAELAASPSSKAKPIPTKGVGYKGQYSPSLHQAKGREMSSFDYVNKTYGLSLKRGSRVEYTGDLERPKFGTVDSADGQYISIHFDGEPRKRGPFHPTWALRHLGEAQK